MSLIGIGAFPGCCRIYGIILRKLMEIVGGIDSTWYYCIYSCFQVLKKTKAAQPWIIKPSSTFKMSCKPRHSKNNSAIFGSFLVDVSRETSSCGNHLKPSKMQLSHKFQRCGSIFYLRFSRWCSIKTSVFWQPEFPVGAKNDSFPSPVLDIQYSNIHIPESFISLDNPWETWWHLGKDSGQADRNRIRPPQKSRVVKTCLQISHWRKCFRLSISFFFEHFIILNDMFFGGFKLS